MIIGSSNTLYLVAYVIVHIHCLGLNTENIRIFPTFALFIPHTRDHLVTVQTYEHPLTYTPHRRRDWARPSSTRSRRSPVISTSVVAPNRQCLTIRWAHEYLYFVLPSYSGLTRRPSTRVDVALPSFRFRWWLRSCDVFYFVEPHNDFWWQFRTEIWRASRREEIDYKVNKGFPRKAAQVRRGNGWRT